ncbi:MAG TPA: hypothetical protein VM145_02440 [Sphingomicrobium sp.]|nr:hypothetical protein [Sphingomicrobium sp.]
MMRLAFLLSFGLAACAPVQAPAVSPQADVQMLALLFDDARSIEAQIAGDFACVSLRQGAGDLDPPQAVIDDLAKRWKVPVVAGSRCSVTGGGDTVAAPGVSGTGKWLRIAKFECRDSNHCTADVSYYVANLGAGGRRLAIERTSRGWRLTPSGVVWIS